jgi:hypothetical protein
VDPSVTISPSYPPAPASVSLEPPPRPLHLADTDAAVPVRPLVGGSVLVMIVVVVVATARAFAKER